MRPRHLKSLVRSEGAAVAPIVAISLFGLIAVGGLAFDYARMATLDTELQSAADQAALAAATQLDGKTGACSRAANAAVDLVANQSRFASGALAVTIPTETSCDATGSIKFYSAYTNASTNTAATSDSNAHFVSVTTETREAVFALTPIVAMLSSGNLTGTAVAGLGSAVCKNPPVMMCNPSEPATNTNVNYPFDANALAGVGLKLVGGDASAPGNFGFLETNFGSGASNLAAALGWDKPPGDCASTETVETKTGLNNVVLNAFNTRFDLDTNGANTCPSGGTCSASQNSRKDLVKGSNCGTTGGQGWQESTNPYRPTTVAALTSGYPDVMGYPRDYCHAVKESAQTCGVVGTGSWDRDAFFRVNYGWNSQTTWTSNTGLPPGAKRYDVYKWELAHPSVGSSPAHGIGVPQPVGSKNAYGNPVCRTPGISPDLTTPDRRRMSVAVLNCAALGLHGHATNQPVLKWVDVFLVEPAFSRGSGSNKFTEDNEVYVEVIGESTSGTAGLTVGQIVRRDAPYLIE